MSPNASILCAVRAALAACAMAVTAPAVAGAALAGASGEGPRSVLVEMDAAGRSQDGGRERARGGIGPVYLNRDGGWFTPGKPNDARANVSSVLRGTVYAPPWEVSDDTWDEVVSCVRDLFAPFAIQIQTEDPGSVPHFECVVTGAQPGEFGLADDVAGVSPFWSDCSVVENSIVYVFPEVLANDGRRACETIAQEVAHSLGLEHAFACEDPMTYIDGCGNKRFQFRELPCGEWSERPCKCRPAGQSSVKDLLERLGPSGEPAMWIAQPDPGRAHQPGFALPVATTRPPLVLEFYLDGILLAAHTPAQGGTQPYEVFEFTAPSFLTPGAHHVEVVARYSLVELREDAVIEIADPVAPTTLVGGCRIGGGPGGRLALLLAGLALMNLVRRRPLVARDEVRPAGAHSARAAAGPAGPDQIRCRRIGRVMSPAATARRLQSGSAMRHSHTIFSTAIVSVALAAGCIGDVPESGTGPDAGAGLPEGSRLVVSPEQFEVPIGSSVTLRGQYLEGGLEVPPPTKITWTSSAPDVAAVDDEGRVQGIAAGTAVIRAVSGRVEGSAVALVTSESTAVAQLEVLRAGNGSGTVISTIPAGMIDCGETCSAFLEATDVTLRADPAQDSTFAGWSEPCSGTGPCTVTLAPGGEVAVTATFEKASAPPPPVQQVELSVQIAGTGKGTVVSSPAAIHCNNISSAGNLCSASYGKDKDAYLYASAEPGSEFAGWSEPGCPGTGPCTVKMTDDKNVTATFNSVLAPQYKLHLQIFDAQGNADFSRAYVTSDPAGITCGAGTSDCSADVAQQATVELMAIPTKASYAVDKWEGCTSISADSYTCTVEMTSAKLVNLYIK
jgi:hypothetical protein